MGFDGSAEKKSDRVGAVIDSKGGGNFTKRAAA